MALAVDLSARVVETTDAPGLVAAIEALEPLCPFPGGCRIFIGEDQARPDPGITVHPHSPAPLEEVPGWRGHLESRPQGEIPVYWKSVPRLPGDTSESWSEKVAFTVRCLLEALRA